MQKIKPMIAPTPLNFDIIEMKRWSEFLEVIEDGRMLFGTGLYRNLYE